MNDPASLRTEALCNARQQSVFNAQTQGPTTHHNMADQVLTHPGRADESILGKPVLGLNNVKFLASGEVLMELFQRVARARGVELVRFIEKFQRPAQKQIFRVMQDRQRHAQLKRLQKFFVREALAN